MRINKKGFTLVELLAVIVVLAIIMIIAVPSVMESMNKAKNSAMKVYAEKMLNQATTSFLSDQLMNPNRRCIVYTLDTPSKDYEAALGIQAGGRYHGAVKAEVTTAGVYTYTVSVQDGQYMISGVTYDTLVSSATNNVVTYDSTKYTTLTCS